jgi:hypothetical protein
MTENMTITPTRDVQAGDGAVRVERSAVAVVRGRNVEASMAGVGLMLAGGDAALNQGIARTLVSGGAIRVHQAGAGSLIAAGEASIRQGGVGRTLTLGSVTVEQGGIGVALARDVRIGNGGFLGLALTPRLDVQPGGRVLLGPREAAVAAGAIVVALVAGAAIVRSARSRTES